MEVHFFIVLLAIKYVYLVYHNWKHLFFDIIEVEPICGFWSKCS